MDLIVPYVYYTNRIPENARFECFSGVVTDKIDVNQINKMTRLVSVTVFTLTILECLNLENILHSLFRQKDFEKSYSFLI